MPDPFEDWLRKVDRDIAESIPTPTVDNIYAELLGELLESAAKAYRYPSPAPGDAEGAHQMVTQQALWYGTTEYAVQVSARLPKVFGVIPMDSLVRYADRVVNLRIALQTALDALGALPESNMPLWWDAFMQLVTDQRLDRDKAEEIALQLARQADGDAWSADVILARVSAYRQHVLPLWQSLLAYGPITPSQPMRCLPRI